MISQVDSHILSKTPPFGVLTKFRMSRPGGGPSFSLSLAGVFLFSPWFWLLCDFLGEAVVRLAGDAEGGILRHTVGQNKTTRRERRRVESGRRDIDRMWRGREMSTPDDA